MSSEKSFELIFPGMALTEVARTLQIGHLPVKAPFAADPQQRPYYDFKDSGVKIFFDSSDVVRTVSFFAPFSKKLRGVFVGMKAEDALAVLGKPTRRWPVADGLDRFIYDQPTFIRIDIDPKTRCVSHIIF